MTDGIDDLRTTVVGEGVEHRHEGGGNFMSQIEGRGVLEGLWRWLGKIKPLVGEEEEGLVASADDMRQEDRAAQGSSKIVLIVGRSVHEARQVAIAKTGKKVESVEIIVPEIVVHAAVQSVCAGPRQKGELTARRAAILGRVGGAQDAELLQCIDGDEAVRGAQRS